MSRGPVLAKPFSQRPGPTTPMLSPRSIQHFDDTSPAPPKSKTKSKSTTKTKSKSTRCHYSSVAGTLRDPTALGCRSACFETSKYCMMPQEQWPSYTLHPAPVLRTSIQDPSVLRAAGPRTTMKKKDQVQPLWSSCPCPCSRFPKERGFCCDFTLFVKYEVATL